MNRHRDIATSFSILLLALAWPVIGAGAAHTVMQTCAPAPINAGQTVNGALSASDCRSPVRGNDFYADRYAFNAPAGAQVAVALAAATHAFRRAAVCSACRPAAITSSR